MERPPDLPGRARAHGRLRRTDRGEPSTRRLYAGGNGRVEKYIYPFLYLNTRASAIPSRSARRPRAPRMTHPAVAGLLHRGRRVLHPRRLGAALPQQLPSGALGRRDALLPPRVRRELHARARRLCTARSTITTRACHCASTGRSSSPASLSRWCTPADIAPTLARACGVGRPRRRPAACWARRSPNDAGNDAVRHRPPQSGAGGLRHIRLWRRVRKTGGFERAGRLRRERPFARADRGQSAAADVRDALRHDELHRAPEYRRARLRQGEAARARQTADGRLRQRLRL